jgi:outer membrane protein OmpA-like peptidoglycan-associated protein
MKLKLLAVLFVLSSSAVSAQDSKHPWSIGGNLGWFDYYSPLKGYHVFNTDKWRFNPSLTLGRYLNPSFDVVGRASYGDVVLHPEKLKYKSYREIHRGIHSYDLLMRYKFNNGYILDEDASLFPFINAGLGLNRIANNTHAVVPIGIGLGLKLSSRFTALLETDYKFPFGMNAIIGRSEHMYTSLGLSYAFGNTAPTIMDEDKDGVSDHVDRCPSLAGSVALHGCPDKDADGVADIDDRCPDFAGVATLMGCPDKDGDLVPDYLDNCPEVYGLRDHAGCPLEKEKPVVIDVPKVIEPVVPTTPDVNEIPDNLVKRVFYMVYKYDLTAEHYQLLDSVITMLNTYPTLKIQIGGHTDKSGSDAINFPLSVNRAEKVKAYFISKGVANSRVFALGYGSTYPLVANDTKENRAKNRRTEIRFQKK